VAAPAPDSIRSPGYPLFLRLVGRPELSHAYLHRVTLWQAGLGVLSVWLTWCLARRFLPLGFAFAATALAVINPHLATISTYILSESLFTTLLLGSVLASIRCVEDGRWWRWVLAGALWAACALVRPTVEFIPLLVAGAAWIFPSLKAYRRGCAIGLVAFVLGMAPWAIRNLHVTNPPGSSLLVKSLVHGSYPGFMYHEDPRTFEYPYRADPDVAIASRDVGSALARIRSNFSDDFLRNLRWYAIEKPGWFLSWGNVQASDVVIYPVSSSPYYEDATFAFLRRLSLFLHWPLMLLGLAGALLIASHGLRARRDGNTPARIVAWTILYAVAAHAVTAPFPRYSIPFRPLLFIAAAMLLAWLFDRIRGKSRATLVVDDRVDVARP
jgi:4-amino-4-deoxy-L-arabinose transferase-like glycosyltransferase